MSLMKRSKVQNTIRTILWIYLLFNLNFNQFVSGFQTSQLIVDNQDEFKIFNESHVSHVQAMQGDNITLKGWYDYNDEAPTHMFNGMPISKSENIRIEWFKNELLLKIANLTEKQTGLYSFYHRSLKSIGQLYLYVKSKNSFAPSESNKIFCEYPRICTLPCRLNNYEDKNNVHLLLDGKVQNNTYKPGVGFHIDRFKLSPKITMANATCVVHNEKVSYIVNFLDVLPNDWRIEMTSSNPWTNLGESVSLTCSVIANASYSGNSLNNLTISVVHEGDGEYKRKCHIDLPKPAKIKHKGDVMVKEREFIVSSFTSECRGKFTCRVKNSSGRNFNRENSVYLDQLEIISRTDANVEIVVGERMKVKAEFRSPSQQKQTLIFNMSSVWEKVTCQGTTCVLTNETSVVESTNDNTKIGYFYDVAPQDAGWHHYSLGIYKGNELIQQVIWDVFVKGQVQVQKNCSKVQLGPTSCILTTISYLPDSTIVFTITEDGHEVILQPVNINRGKYLVAKTYEVVVTTAVNIGYKSQGDRNIILLTVFAVEFSYYVHPTFDNANAQDIYEGDTVTIKGRVALSNDSFLIQHESDSSLCPSKSEKFSECTLSNYNFTSNQTFRLISQEENVVATIDIPAAKKVIPPFNKKVLTKNETESFVQLICPIDGSPIIYNWTVDGILIPGQSAKSLVIDRGDLHKDHTCGAMNRVGSKRHNFREANDKFAWINGYVAFLAVVLLYIVAAVLFKFCRKHHQSQRKSSQDEANIENGDQKEAFILTEKKPERTEEMEEDIANRLILESRA